MAKAVNLSKDWTLARSLGLLRVLVNQVAPDKIKFMKLVVDNAKLMIYENLGEIAPESLTNTVNSSVNLIRQSNLAELGVIKNKISAQTKDKGRRNN